MAHKRFQGRSKSKYRNVPVYACAKPGCPGSYEASRPRECGYCQGEDFDCFASIKEFRRWRELQLLQLGGVISGLTRQVPFLIVVNGVKICKFIVDHQYRNDVGEPIVEDVKTIATMTAVYRLKKKLVGAVYGVVITEYL